MLFRLYILRHGLGGLKLALWASLPTSASWVAGMAGMCYAMNSLKQLKLYSLVPIHVLPGSCPEFSLRRLSSSGIVAWGIEDHDILDLPVVSAVLPTSATLSDGCTALRHKSCLSSVCLSGHRRKQSSPLELPLPVVCSLCMAFWTLGGLHLLLLNSLAACHWWYSLDSLQIGNLFYIKEPKIACSSWTAALGAWWITR